MEGLGNGLKSMTKTRKPSEGCGIVASVALIKGACCRGQLTGALTGKMSVTIGIASPDIWWYAA